MRQLDTSNNEKKLISDFKATSPHRSRCRSKKKIILKTLDRAYSAPSPDEIENSSKIKLKNDLNNICDELYFSGIFKDAPKFKNTMIKRGKNLRAILHTLTSCYRKKSFDGKGPWAYCVKIIQIENGNFNERDYRKTT